MGRRKHLAHRVLRGVYSGCRQPGNANGSRGRQGRPISTVAQPRPGRESVGGIGARGLGASILNPGVRHRGDIVSYNRRTCLFGGSGQAGHIDASTGVASIHVPWCCNRHARLTSFIVLFTWPRPQSSGRRVLPLDSRSIVRPLHRASTATVAYRASPYGSAVVRPGRSR